MSLDVEKKAVDLIVSNLLKKEQLNLLAKKDEMATVTFFGGEPTLLWDEIIVPLVDYAEKQYPKLVQFNMTTNGTLLNEERIKYLSLHNIPILLSIDGNEVIQNKNRPCRNSNLNSFDLVNKNIPFILEYFPNTTFRATISQDNCKNIFENCYLFAIQKGFKSIFLCPNAREIWTKENLNIFHTEINKIWTYIILTFLNEEQPISCSLIDKAFIDVLLTDLQVYNKVYNIINPNRNIMRCGLGAGSFSVGYDGKIFACQEQDSRDTNDFFYIGDIFSGINKEKHSKILQHYGQTEPIKNADNLNCENCVLRSICLDETCPSVSYDLYKNCLIRPTINCLQQQWMFENATIAMDILVKNNSQTFKKYITDLYAPYEKKEGK